MTLKEAKEKIVGSKVYFGNDGHEWEVISIEHRHDSLGSKLIMFRCKNEIGEIDSFNHRCLKSKSV